MLNPTFKVEWLEALRSGKYPKGKHSLRRTTVIDGKTVDQFCCLGVAREIRPDLKPYKDTYLDEASAATVGLTEKTQGVLVYLNDTSPTFDKVITYIEEEL